jgi:hypothetical protein
MTDSPSGVMPGVLCPRRSNRKATIIPIWLRNEEHRPMWEEETETLIVSRCGAGVRCRHLASSESIVVIVRRDTGKRAKARVRYSRYNPDGKRELGVEFIGIDNFWGLDWNSSEPRDSQPEQTCIDSGCTPIGDAMVAAEIAQEQVRRTGLGVPNRLGSDEPSSKRLKRQLTLETGFVFTKDGKPIGPPVRTLREFASSLKNSAPSVAEGHIHRGDFSRWIGQVIDDQFLAAEIQKLEQRYCPGHSRDLCDSLARIIAEYCSSCDEP